MKQLYYIKSIERLKQTTFYLLEDYLDEQERLCKQIEEVRIVGGIKLQEKSYFLYEYINYPNSKDDLDFCYKEMKLFMKKTFTTREEAIKANQ